MPLPPPVTTATAPESETNSFCSTNSLFLCKARLNLRTTGVLWNLHSRLPQKYVFYVAIAARRRSYIPEECCEVSISGITFCGVAQTLELDKVLCNLP